MHVLYGLSNFTYDVKSRQYPIERSMEDLEKDEVKFYAPLEIKDDSGKVIQRLKKFQWYIQEGNKLSFEEIYEDV